MKRSGSQMVPAQAGAAIATPGSTNLRDFDDTAHRAPLGGPDQRVVRDPHRMERGPHLAPPVSEEVEKHRKVGREIMMLPDEQLEQRRRVGTQIMDTRRPQPIAVAPNRRSRAGEERNSGG